MAHDPNPNYNKQSPAPIKRETKVVVDVISSNMELTHPKVKLPMYCVFFVLKFVKR